METEKTATDFIELFTGLQRGTIESQYKWVITMLVDYSKSKSMNIVRSLVETEACESCEKQTPIDEMKTDSGSDCSFCPKCYSEGVISMYSDFCKLYPKEYQNYRSAMEQGALIDDLLQQKKEIEQKQINEDKCDYSEYNKQLHNHEISLNDYCYNCKGKEYFQLNK